MHCAASRVEQYVEGRNEKIRSGRELELWVERNEVLLLMRGMGSPLDEATTTRCRRMSKKTQVR